MKTSESLKERRIESQHRLQGSIFAAVLMLLLMGTLRACQVWEAPNPPPPKYGMIVDFGNMVQGGEPDVVQQPEARKPTVKPEAAPAPSPEPDVVTAENDLPPLNEEPEPLEPEPLPEEKPEPEEEKVETKEQVEPKEEQPARGQPAEESGDSGQDQTPENNQNTTGTEAGEEGSSLDLTGWRWTHPPIVQDDSREIGSMEFGIVIDEYGEVMAVNIKKSYGVSLSLANKYKEAIEQMIFVPVGGGTPPPGFSRGTIRIVLKRK